MGGGLRKTSIGPSIYETLAVLIYFIHYRGCIYKCYTLNRLDFFNFPIRIIIFEFNVIARLFISRILHRVDVLR